MGFNSAFKGLKEPSTVPCPEPDKYCSHPSSILCYPYVFLLGYPDQNLVYFSHLPILSFASGASWHCVAPYRPVFPRPVSLHPQCSAPCTLTGDLWFLYVPSSVCVFGWRSQWWQHCLWSVHRTTNFSEQRAIKTAFNGNWSLSFGRIRRLFNPLAFLQA